MNQETTYKPNNRSIKISFDGGEEGEEGRG
jgi:hypothetical protein